MTDLDRANRYMIVKDSLQNVWKDGVCTGYSVQLRVPYYRGFSLSLLNFIAITVDGVAAKTEDMRFTVDGETFTFDEMRTVVRYRWEMTEPGTVSVNLPGGLPEGRHTVEAKISLNVTYMAKGAYDYAIEELEVHCVHGPAQKK